MNDELDSEVFEDLSPGQGETAPEAGDAPPFPVLQTLGSGPRGVTRLCQDPAREGVRLVQKLMGEVLSSENPDLVEGGFGPLAGLAHPGLAMVLDYGWEGSQAYLVREYVMGKPLLEALAGAGTPEILLRFAQLLQILDYLHARNVHHLHLKPENIYFGTAQEGQEDRVMLCDFGLGSWLAKKGEGEEDFFGTPPYTAPECAVEPFPDPRADLYSVGALLYSALSGRPPFSGGNPHQILERQKNSDPPSLESMGKASAKIWGFVQRLLSRDPQKRFSHPREGLLALIRVAGIQPGSKNYSSPPVFSNPALVFREKYFSKTFRRIFLQGRLWAFEGERGSGKTFFARWLHRYFLINKKQVRSYRGEEVHLLVGERVFSPAEPLYVIVDDADHGPVQAWLSSRQYPNVMIFGESLPWAHEDPRWQVFPLEQLDPTQLRDALERELETMEDGVFKELSKWNQGSPGRLVQQCRGLTRLGLLQPGESGWKLESQKFSQMLSSPQAAAMGNPLMALEKSLRGPVALLAMAAVPLALEELAQWFDLNPAVLRRSLISLSPEEMVERKVWMGREYFHSLIPPPDSLDLIGEPAQVRLWVEKLEQADWYQAGIRLLDRYFSDDDLKSDPVLTVMRCSLAVKAGQYGDVFKWINASFVKVLSEKLKGEAFEILGRALKETGKIPQAEAAYKNAFAQFRAQQDLAGQSRILLDFGNLSQESGDTSRALKFLEQALNQAAKSAQPERTLGRVDLEIAKFYAGTTDYAKAEPRFISCLDRLHQNRQEVLLAKAYLEYGKMLGVQGQDEAMEYYAREGLNLAAFKEVPKIQGEAYLTLAELEEQRGNHAALVERLKEAVFVLAQIPVGPLYVKALLLQAYHLESGRQLKQAEKIAQQALKLAFSFKDPELLGLDHLVMGKILRRDISRQEEALKQFELAREEFQKIRNLRWGWECEFEKGEIERNQNHVEAGRSHFQRALKMIDEYLRQLAPPARERFLNDGKRERVEMALKS